MDNILFYLVQSLNRQNIICITYFIHTPLQKIIHIRTNHTIPTNNHFKSSKLTKFHRSTKTDITPRPQEFSIPHENYINNTVRTNPLLSNFSDENSLTTGTHSQLQKNNSILKTNLDFRSINKTVVTSTIFPFTTVVNSGISKQKKSIPD